MESVRNANAWHGLNVSSCRMRPCHTPLPADNPLFEFWIMTQGKLIIHIDLDADCDLSDTMPKSTIVIFDVQRDFLFFTTIDYGIAI
jgi:hypothetical protein